jgi:transcription elongation GreA/GreB family factor
LQPARTSGTVPTLNKQTLIEHIIDALSGGLDNLTRSARAAHAEATDEQSKAENKYDTRGLEASYLARGQSRQAMEVVEALKQYRALTPRAFAASEPIDLGALVEVKRGRERTFYFLGPGAGGTEVNCEGETVVAITPQSPLGRELMGRKAGDPVAAPGAKGDEARVVSVS